MSGSFYISIWPSILPICATHSIAFFLQSRPHDFYYVTMQYLLAFLNKCQNRYRYRNRPGMVRTGIGIESCPCLGIGIVPESAQTWARYQYRNRNRKSWNHRLLTKTGGSTLVIAFNVQVLQEQQMKVQLNKIF